MNEYPSESGPESPRNTRPIWLTVVVIVLTLCILACAVLMFLGPALGNSLYQILQITPFAPSP